MKTKSPGTFITELKDIARAAGEAIKDVRARGADVEEKADGSPVTEADHAANEVICERLEELNAKWPVVSEEGELEKAEELGTEKFWLVDPLDGTKEFVKGLPEYTVNIALIDDGYPVAGVIQIPESGLLYHAIRGKGAWRSEGRGSGDRIRVSDRKNGKITAAISRSHSDEVTERLLEKLGVDKTIRRGSSLKICSVAEGPADVYLRPAPTWLWDTAAGTIILREAGGCVTGLQPIMYRPEERMKLDTYVASCNGKLAFQAREALREAFEMTDG